MACPKCGSNDTWDDNFWSGCNACGWMHNCERDFDRSGWQKESGISLIEIMIIIAIAGIIAAFTFPVYLDHKKKERCNGDVQCLQQLQIEHNHSLQIREMGGRTYSTIEYAGSTQCLHGYVVLPNGSQMIDNKGYGVPCQ